MKIDITNGDCFNQYAQEHYEGNFIPFREAMIEGESTPDIFGQEFNKVRAAVHKIAVEDYLAHMKDFYRVIADVDGYESITLWFGVDAFCQINLLTILAYLDRAEYGGKVETVLIEDGSFKIVRDRTAVAADGYYEKYTELMLNRKSVEFGDGYLNDAAQQYLDLCCDDGRLANIIKQNCGNMTKRQLFELVWRNSREYGLGDTQVLKLIEKYGK